MLFNFFGLKKEVIYCKHGLSHEQSSASAAEKALSCSCGDLSAPLHENQGFYNSMWDMEIHSIYTRVECGQHSSLTTSECGLSDPIKMLL